MIPVEPLRKDFPRVFGVGTNKCGELRVTGQLEARKGETCTSA